MKTLFKDIIIPSLKGKKTIARSDLFSYVDSDFEKYGTDNIGESTEEGKLKVMEIEMDGTFGEIFSDPENMFLSQEQILWFVENETEKLSKDWYTFFLFKVGGEFFVASVYVYSGGLEVGAYRFSYVHVWDADGRRRVVVPQLTSGTSGTGLTPGSSETLTLSSAIEMVKKEGYVVYKPA